MTDPLTAIGTRATPQVEPIPGTIPNSAGGHAFEVDIWTRLRRFLILGTEGGTYYISEHDLTRQNADALLRCVETDGLRVVEQILEVSLGGLAPKQNATLFALAACVGADDPATRRAAEAAIPKVCRIGTHLFIFARYVEQFRGWGRGLRRAVGRWYLDRDIDALCLQLIKYQQREGWSHRDLLRLSHPTATDPATNAALRWAAQKNDVPMPAMIAGFEEAKLERDPRRVAELAVANRLPWEALPSESLISPIVWEALLPSMGLTALIRNLGRLTSLGVKQGITQRLADADAIRATRVHPMQFLLALSTYRQGHGDRGHLTWQPDPNILDVLDEGFYAAFGNVPTTGKRYLLGVDVSGSMANGGIAGSNLTPREGSVAMALVTLHTETDVTVMGFTGGFVPLPLSRRQRLDDAVRSVSNLPFERTDCSLPMLYAIDHKLDVDTFVVYTDSETWAGGMHPVQALREYRQRSGIPARLVVVGMVSNGFSIADPADGGMLDVVGFDASAPALISEFSMGSI